MPELTLVEALATPYQTPTGTAASFDDPDRRLSFQQIFDTRLAPYLPDGLIRFADWQRLDAAYRDVIAHPPFILSGMLHLDDHAFLENDALPVNMARREALIGGAIGWGTDYAAWYIDDHRLKRVIDTWPLSKGLRSVIKNPALLRPLPPAIIMSCPGHDIYGHWLIDILPRLTSLRHPSIDRLPILLNLVPTWAGFFLEALDIDPGRVRRHPGRFFSLEQALLPTMCKTGSALAPRLLREAWDLVLAHYQRNPLPGPPSPKIFLSRSRWGLRMRDFADRDTIDQHMIRRGYRVVHPQDLAVREQIALMQGARIVVGEDGSALHNVAFCRPGAALGVLSTPERDNLYHFSICQIRGHKVGYCPVADGLSDDAAATVLDDFLDVLEAEADL